jgi:hypothetical protein
MKQLTESELKMIKLRQKLHCIENDMDRYRKNSWQYKRLKGFLLETLEEINDATPEEMSCQE